MIRSGINPLSVIPAQAATRGRATERWLWVPDSAGTTITCGHIELDFKSDFKRGPRSRGPLFFSMLAGHRGNYLSRDFLSSSDARPWLRFRIPSRCSDLSCSSITITIITAIAPMMAPRRRATRNVVVGKLSILLDDPGNYLVNVIDRFLEGRAIRGQKTVPMVQPHPPEHRAIQPTARAAPYGCPAAYTEARRYRVVLRLASKAVYQRMVN